MSCAKAAEKGSCTSAALWMADRVEIQARRRSGMRKVWSMWKCRSKQEVDRARALNEPDIVTCVALAPEQLVVIVQRADLTEA